MATRPQIAESANITAPLMVIRIQHGYRPELSAQELMSSANSITNMNCRGPTLGQSSRQCAFRKGAALNFLGMASASARVTKLVASKPVEA
jgi:hypothetical protein